MAAYCSAGREPSGRRQDRRWPPRASVADHHGATGGVGAVDGAVLLLQPPGEHVHAGPQATDHGWVIQNPEGFLENAVRRQNRAVTTMVLRFGEIQLPSFATRLLQVPERTIGFELVRLRYLDGTPALYSVNYSPPTVAPFVVAAKDVLAGIGSLSELLAKAGFPLRGAHRTIRAVAPAREVAEVLEVSDTTPVLCIQSTSWSDNEQRFDVYETWLRSDVVPLEVNVSAIDLGITR